MQNREREREIGERESEREREISGEQESFDHKKNDLWEIVS